MLSGVFGGFSDDIAIDLGTANTIVFVPGRDGPAEVNRNRLPEGGNATPAVVGDSLILRTETRLYRIREQ